VEGMTNEPVKEREATGHIRPMFDPRITFGNLLTMLAMAVAGLAIFFSVQGATASNAEKIARQEVTLKDHEARIRIIEGAVSGGLARIDTRLEGIEKELAK
jgi:hypothetical protein